MKLFKLSFILTFLAFFAFSCSQTASNSSNNANTNRITQNVNGTIVSYDIVTENTNSNSNQAKPSNK